MKIKATSMPRRCDNNRTLSSCRSFVTITVTETGYWNTLKSFIIITRFSMPSAAATAATVIQSLTSGQAEARWHDKLLASIDWQLDFWIHELIPYRYSSCCSSSRCCRSCWRATRFEKPKDQIVSKRINMKFGRIVPQVNTHRFTGVRFFTFSD